MIYLCFESALSKNIQHRSYKYLQCPKDVLQTNHFLSSLLHLNSLMCRKIFSDRLPQTPSTLFAAIQTPSPLLQIVMPRSTLPFPIASAREFQNQSNQHNSSTRCCQNQLFHSLLPKFFQFKSSMVCCNTDLNLFRGCFFLNF